MADVILGKEALEQVAGTVTKIVHLMAEIENANADISELCDQLKDKVDISKAETKRIAKAVYNESYLDQEKEKLESLEDMLQALEGKL